MLAVPRSGFRWKGSNVTAPAGTPGTSVIPGASDVEGSWTQILAGASIAYDVYLFNLQVIAGNTTGQIKSHLLDIGIDQAGGTSYTAVISNIVCGASGGAQQYPQCFTFPFFIKAGSSVAVRVQGSNATAGTVRVWMNFYGLPSRPELVKVGQVSETVGAITGSQGVDITSGIGVVGAKGSWVSLGVTTKPCWWWQIGVQCSTDAAITTDHFIDLGVGDGTAGGTHIIIADMYFITSSAEICGNRMIADACIYKVPVGATLYARGACSAAAAAPNYNAVAIGIA